MDFTSIKLLILDVDGVLTDGRITATGGDDVGKRFHVRDGCAIKLWRESGGRVAILSGRTSVEVSNRAVELGIEIVRMGESRKMSAFEDICREASCRESEIAYVGDDLPDLGPMGRCGVAIAVGDAAGAVKRVADYVTSRRGGDGAVAEAVEWILRKQGRWSRDRLCAV